MGNPDRSTYPDAHEGPPALITMPTVALPDSAFPPSYKLGEGGVDGAFMSDRMARMDNMRRAGNYSEILAEGDQYFSENPDIVSLDDPSNQFLSEMSAFICLLLDPLRDRENLNIWLNRLDNLIKRFDRGAASGLGVFYLDTLALIRDFLYYCQRYIETLEEPFERLLISGEEFSFEKFDEFDRRIGVVLSQNLQNLRDHPARDYYHLSNRIFRLLARLQIMVKKMKTATIAEMDRWKHGMVTRDRDAAIRTKLFSAELQTELRGNENRSSVDRLIASLIQELTRDEVPNSPLARSLRLAQIRCLIDQGQYSLARQNGDVLMRQTPHNDYDFISQVNGTVGYGLFIFAELVLNHDENPQISFLLNTQKSLLGCTGSIKDIANKIIEIGIGYLRSALQQAEASDNPILAARFRSQLLHGYNLMLSTEELYEKGAMGARSILPAAVRDVLNGHAFPLEIRSILTPRIAIALERLIKRNRQTMEELGLEKKGRDFIALLRDSVTFLSQELAGNSRSQQERLVTPLGVAVREILGPEGAHAGFVHDIQTALPENHVPEEYYAVLFEKKEAVSILYRILSGGATTQVMKSATRERF